MTGLRSALLALFAAAGLVVAGARSGSAATIIHDETFTPGTWSASVLGGTNITSAAAGVEVGTGVTGNALLTTMGHSGSFTFDVLERKVDRPWIPAVDGAIVSFDWEFWYRVPTSSAYHGMFLAASQGGSVYTGPRVEPQLFVNQWQRAAGSLTPDAMLRRFGGGPLMLDFSPSAEPITFGMLLVREIFSTGATFRHSFFDVEIESVPVVAEPSRTVLGLLAAAGSAVLRRRNARWSPRP